MTVYERNRIEDTFGFGVVFSDETLENVGEADPETNQAMAAAAARWEDIEIHYRGTVMRSTGHRFSGVERKTLLELLARRAQSLGVEIQWQREIRDLSDCGLPAADLIVAADGVASPIRDRLADQFQPQLDWRRNRFVWLGTTRPFPAFTFYFKSSPAGLWRTHAYQYAPGRSTFIVEAREETWQASGLDENDEPATVAYLEGLFEEELQGHPLLANRSIWRRFPTVRNAPLARGQRRAAGRRRPHGALLGGLGHQAGDGGRDRAGGGAQGRAIDSRGARQLRGRPAPAGGEPPARGPGEPRVVRVGGALPRHRAAPVRLQPAHPKPPHHPREPAGARSGPGGAGGPLVRRAGRAGRADAVCRSIPLRHRCSRPTGSASWCCRTGSWSPRCASTGRTTACRTIGTWCTSAAGRSAAPGW